MSTSGKTIWWPKDTAWWRRERIVALGEEFGADGPAVIDWLSCEAKVQNDGGWVKSGPRSIARGCFVPVATVCHVLSRSVTLGLLDDYTEEAGVVTCRLSGFGADAARGAATLRQQAKRRREEEEREPSHAPLRDVTASHAASHKSREEQRREEDSPSSSSVAGARVA